MLLALGDSHATDDSRLPDDLQQAVTDAAVVVHTGDFTTERVLDRFDALADRLVAVCGNRDSAAVRERLPDVATVEYESRRVLVVHGHEHDRTTLSLLARQEGADVVVVGHTHHPTVERLGERTVLNPGSYADPRGTRPAYATIGQAGRVVQLRTPAGEPFAERSL